MQFDSKTNPQETQTLVPGSAANLVCLCPTSAGEAVNKKHFLHQMNISAKLQFVN